jgi:hypothetical protein
MKQQLNKESYVIDTLHQKWHYESEQIKRDEIGGSCSIYVDRR